MWEEAIIKQSQILFTYTVQDCPAQGQLPLIEEEQCPLHVSTNLRLILFFGLKALMLFKNQ